MPPAPARLRAVDWLRGGATVAMVQCHALALLRPDLRSGQLFGLVAWLDGLIAPSFFAAAGFSLALLQVRSGGSWRRAGRSLFRISQVLAVQVGLTSLWWNVLVEPQWLLRIDVLSCIGVTLALLVVPVTLLASRPAVLTAAAVGAALALLFATPVLAHAPGAWGHFLGTASGSVFPLAPWGAHLVFGAGLGALAGRDAARFARELPWLGLGAAGLAALAWSIDAFLPAHDYFSQPWAHLERWAEVCFALSLLLRLEARAGASGRAARAVELLSRCSLSAYALHEVWLYTSRLGFCFHDAWGDRSSWPAYLGETAALLGLTTLGCAAIDFASSLPSRLRAARAIPPVP